MLPKSSSKSVFSVWLQERYALLSYTCTSPTPFNLPSKRQPGLILTAESWLITASSGCCELEQVKDLVEKDCCWTFPNTFVPSELHWERTSAPNVPYCCKVHFICLNADALLCIYLGLINNRKAEFISHKRFCSVVTIHLNSLCIMYLTTKKTSDRCHWHATRCFYTQYYYWFGLSFR